MYGWHFSVMNSDSSRMDTSHALNVRRCFAQLIFRCGFFGDCVHYDIVLLMCFLPGSSVAALSLGDCAVCSSIRVSSAVVELPQSTRLLLRNRPRELSIGLRFLGYCPLHPRRHCHSRFVARSRRCPPSKGWPPRSRLGPGTTSRCHWASFAGPFRQRVQHPVWIEPRWQKCPPHPEFRG